MFGSSEMIIVLVIVLVLFGGSQLPKLAKNLGMAQKEFKYGNADADKPGTPVATATQQVDQPAPPPAPPTPPAT